MEVVSDVKVLEKEYPCLAAVNRCANCRICFYPTYCFPQSPFDLFSQWHLILNGLLSLCHPLAGVPRHQGRVIKLLYCGEGPVQKTLMLVGKVRGTLSLASLKEIKSVLSASFFFFFMIQQFTLTQHSDGSVFTVTTSCCWRNRLSTNHYSFYLDVELYFDDEKKKMLFFFFFRVSLMTRAVPTSKPEVSWPGCTATSVEQQLWPASSRWVWVSTQDKIPACSADTWGFAHWPPSYTLHQPLDFGQAEAQTPEGCRLHGHGEEQRWLRSVHTPFSSSFASHLSLTFPWQRPCPPRLLRGRRTGGLPRRAQSEGGQHGRRGPHGDGGSAVWDEGEGA